MPRAILSEDDSDIGDIPFKKTETKQQAMAKGKGGKGKGKAKAEPIEDVSNAVAEDDEDEDMDADEFAVEHIVSHRFEPDGTLKLEVKWVGWPDSANTWEPEENLDGAKDELATYYQEIDGKPTFGAVKTRKSVPTASKTTSTKRKADSPPAAALKAESKRGRPAAKKLKTEETAPRGSTATGTHTDLETGKQFKLPDYLWEDSIVSISTIVRDDEGMLKGLVQWADGKKSQHALQVLYTRCPQKMLKFYEGCIEFRANEVYLPYEEQQKTKEEEEEEDQTMADAAMAGADKLLESVGEIVKPAENAVKGVAASTVKGVASIGSAVKGVVARSTPKAAAVPKVATPKVPTPKSATPKAVVEKAASTVSSAVKEVASTNGNHAEPAEES